MRNKPVVLLLAALSFGIARSQNVTFSPYSRYGLGERAQKTFAHNMAMGGAFVALRPDSTMPVFVNAGNPAAYPLIRVTSLEVGGRYNYSDFSGANTGTRKWTTNFTYAALGFPVGARGGACFGMMPYSSVGYNSEGVTASPVGDINRVFAGSGGINKVFLGYGLMPFNKRVVRYRTRHFPAHDSLQTRSHRAIMRGYFFSKLLGDLSAGVEGQYLFGNMSHTTRYFFPNNTLYNNTYTERSLHVGDFTGRIGLQTGFAIDSVRRGNTRRALSEKVRFTFGFYMALGNSLKVRSSSVAYNYILSQSGQELVTDTVTFLVDRPGEVVLPVEQGIGMGFKKGERWSVAGDLAVVRWRNFSAPDHPVRLSNSYRLSVGANYVPEKYAAGRNAFWRRIQYRAGGSYETAYIDLPEGSVPTWYGSLGFGVPVGIGRISSMVHVSLQAGQTGIAAPGLIRENFVRVHVGFTFCDRWFQKFRYD